MRQRRPPRVRRALGRVRTLVHQVKAGIPPRLHWGGSVRFSKQPRVALHARERPPLLCGSVCVCVQTVASSADPLDIWLSLRRVVATAMVGRPRHCLALPLGQRPCDPCRAWGWRISRPGDLRHRASVHCVGGPPGGFEREPRHRAEAVGPALPPLREEGRRSARLPAGRRHRGGGATQVQQVRRLGGVGERCLLMGDRRGSCGSVSQHCVCAATSVAIIVAIVGVESPSIFVALVIAVRRLRPRAGRALRC